MWQVVARDPDVTHRDLDKFPPTFQWVSEDNITRLDSSQSSRLLRLNHLYHAHNSLEDKGLWLSGLAGHDEISHLHAPAVMVVPLVHETKVAGNVERGEHTGSKGSMNLKTIVHKEMRGTEELDGECSTLPSCWKGKGRHLTHDRDS